MLSPPSIIIHFYASILSSGLLPTPQIQGGEIDSVESEGKITKYHLFPPLLQSFSYKLGWAATFHQTPINSEMISSGAEPQARGNELHVACLPANCFGIGSRLLSRGMRPMPRPETTQADNIPSPSVSFIAKQDVTLR